VRLVSLNSRCTGPTTEDKKALVSLGFARIHSEVDTLKVDPNMDAYETAVWLREMFQFVFSAYVAKFPDRVSSQTPTPCDWFVHLGKRNRDLFTFPGQVGATMRQLLDNASMTGNRPKSKEIFLGMLRGRALVTATQANILCDRCAGQIAIWATPTQAQALRQGEEDRLRV
jgi:hypothetical protein